MPSPYQWPWVDPISVSTVAIDSTPTIVFGQQITCFIDSVYLCNTTDQEIFVDISLLQEREVDDEFVVKSPFLKRKLFIPNYGSVELFDLPKTMEPGDLMYANSDLSGNRFDCVISARRLLETAGVLSARRKN